jgi:hypothetical protein
MLAMRRNDPEAFGAAPALDRAEVILESHAISPFRSASEALRV